MGVVVLLEAEVTALELPDSGRGGLLLHAASSSTQVYAKGRRADRKRMAIKAGCIGKNECRFPAMPLSSLSFTQRMARRSQALNQSAAIDSSNIAMMTVLACA